MRTWVRVGLLAAALAMAGWPAAAEPDHIDMTPFQKMEELQRISPVSPNGRPMEAGWRFAAEAPDGQLGAEPGPYLVSTWGNIVVRGRREGDRIISALNTVQCGREGDPATQVTLLGQPPADLCKSVEVIPEGRAKTIGSDNGTLFGANDGWALMNFAQKVGETWFGGAPPAEASGDKYPGVAATGAFYMNENGRHVFYAPGETVEVVAGNTILVRPVMTADEVEAELMHQALSKIDGDSELDRIVKNSQAAQPKEKPPGWFYLFFFGIPLAAVAGLVYLVRRVMGRRRGALPGPIPQFTGALPARVLQSPGAAPNPLDLASADDQQATPTPPEPPIAVLPPVAPMVAPAAKPQRNAGWWASQSVPRRRMILGGTAAAVVIASLFAAFRPVETDAALILRKAYGENRAGTVRSEFASGLSDEVTLQDEPRYGVLQSPAPGHQARFHWYHIVNGLTGAPRARVTIDAFATAADAAGALADIKAHGRSEVLLLPADSNSATSFAEALAAPGKPPRDFECRRTADHLFCMTRPGEGTILLTVRAPNDSAMPTGQGIGTATTTVVEQTELAIQGLGTLGIGK